MQSLLQRLDRACEVINIWLLVIAISLSALVMTVGIARLAPPAAPSHARNVR